jgi:hypothetical protein
MRAILEHVGQRAERLLVMRDLARASRQAGAGQAHLAEQGSIDDLPTVLDLERRAATGTMACFFYDALAPRANMT